MGSTIQQMQMGARPCSAGLGTAKRARPATASFLDLAAQVGKATSSAIPVDKKAQVESYRKHLESKYGRVTIQSVKRDQQSLEKIGKSMGGHDVVIAPHMLEKMAADKTVAACYEQKIDYFFDTIIPRETARCAAMGLVFEPCGVVVHEDGSVTYICGCSDSPERVAEVNRINRERDEKRAAQRQEYLAQAGKAAARRRAIWASQADMGLRGSVPAFPADFRAAAAVSTSTLPDTGFFYI